MDTDTTVQYSNPKPANGTFTRPHQPIPQNSCLPIPGATEVVPVLLAHVGDHRKPFIKRRSPLFQEYHIPGDDSDPSTDGHPIDSSNYDSRIRVGSHNVLQDMKLVDDITRGGQQSGEPINPASKKKPYIYSDFTNQTTPSFEIYEDPCELVEIPRPTVTWSLPQRGEFGFELAVPNGDHRNARQAAAPQKTDPGARPQGCQEQGMMDRNQRTFKKEFLRSMQSLAPIPKYQHPIVSRADTVPDAGATPGRVDYPKPAGHKTDDIKTTQPVDQQICTALAGEAEGLDTELEYTSTNSLDHPPSLVKISVSSTKVATHTPAGDEKLGLAAEEAVGRKKQME